MDLIAAIEDLRVLELRVAQALAVLGLNPAKPRHGRRSLAQAADSTIVRSGGSLGLREEVEMPGEADRISGLCMLPARAEEIRKAIKAAHGWVQVGVCPTKGEDREITRFWNTLPSGTSYYDAVARMAKGEHLNEEGGK